MQQLDNESNARDADTQYMIEAGKLHASYNALEGKARVDAYDDYAKNLQETRTRLRGTLGNPQAQKMYDASSLSTMGRTIFNGAGAAATAQVQYNKQTAIAQMDLDSNAVELDPKNEGLFQEKVQRTKDNAEHLAVSEGAVPGDPRSQDIAAKAVSRMSARRIIGMARNQPYQASQLFEDYKAKGLLRDDDINTVEGKVQGFAHTVGAATIADNVLARYRQPDGTYSKSFEVMQAEAGAEGAERFPNDPKMAIATKGAFDINYNQVKRAKTFDNQDRKQEVSSYITKGVNDVSMLPTSLTDRMTPDEIKQFPAQANAYHHALDVQTNQSKYNELLGMYNNDNAGFMGTDIYRVPGLSKSNIDFFIGLQRKAAANGDPRVGKAMKDIQSFAPAALDALNVTGPNMNRDTHNQFVGALHSAIQGWQEEYGKPPNPKELQETIYPSLLRQVAEPGWLWGENKTEFFKSQVPKPIVESATKALGREPNEVEAEQLRNEYMRAQFNQFYKGAKAKLGDRFPK